MISDQHLMAIGHAALLATPNSPGERLHKYRETYKNSFYAEFKLSGNQAALILGVSEDGEIKVDMAVAATENDATNLAAAICQVIATKLVSDAEFQEEIMAAIEEEDE